MRLAKIQRIGTLGLLGISPYSLAAIPALSLGDIAEKFLVGSDFITRFALIVCVSVGIIMFILGITHFRGHRENPKMVPLGRPVMYVVLGFCLVMVPFFESIFGQTGSILEIKKKEQAPLVCPVDIDAPLEFGNEFNH
jgi:hypothetical protein